MTILAVIGGLILLGLVCVGALGLCWAAAAGDRVQVVPDEPTHSGDTTDLWLRLDGLTAAIDTAVTQLADGRIADAQVTLGEAANIENAARLEDSLHLIGETNV